MKVALIETHAIPGVWKYDLGLAQELTTLGNDVTIITSKSFPQVNANSSAIDIVRIFPDLRAHSSFLAKGILYLVGTFKAINLVRTNEFDVVHWQHFNTLIPAETLLAKALTWLKQRLVITVHDVDPWSTVKVRANFLLKTTYQAAGRLIVHHKANVHELSAKYGIQESRIRVVPHGSYVEFSLSKRDKSASRELLDIPVDAKVILFFGEIRPEKGLIHLIRAVKILYPALPSLKLVIAGRPRHMDMSECLDEVTNSGLDDAVIARLDYIDDSQVEAYFAMADLIAIPYTSITQSGILFEAMTAGRPVVASDIGAVGPTVQENGIGHVVPPGDEEQLAQAISDILENPDLASQMSKNGLRASKEIYSWARCARDTDAIYGELQSTNHLN
ncbi:MAG: glycosyltransferase family 4 protein [Woeseiaceae bacterium]